MNIFVFFFNESAKYMYSEMEKYKTVKPQNHIIKKEVIPRKRHFQFYSLKQTDTGNFMSSRRRIGFIFSER